MSLLLKSLTALALSAFGLILVHLCWWWYFTSKDCSPCKCSVPIETIVPKNNKRRDEIQHDFTRSKKTISDRSNSSIILTDKIFDDSIQTSTSGSTSYEKHTGDSRSTLDGETTTSVPARGTSLRDLLLKIAEGLERPRRQGQPPTKKPKKRIHRAALVSWPEINPPAWLFSLAVYVYLVGTGDTIDFVIVYI